ncbi:MAG: phosphate signaling complex protein PhoU [Marinosulfonomonas sp.]|nr:phosphate signaling complex protein PhoU [Marinosulfonomonas sp.]
MTQTHIVKKFDKNLEKIKATIVEMGGLVGLQVNDATAVLSAYDAAEVARITAYDRIINGLNKDIHDRAEILIVRRQPMALDLRQTLAPINIAGELERIGDHAKSTAKRAHIIHNTPPQDAALELIAQMSVIVQAMLGDVLVAYGDADIDLAARIREQDKEVDVLNKQLVQVVIETLAKTPEMAESLIHLTLISRNFERIGDHVCNIARYVHQIVTGEDLKASSRPAPPRTDT